MSISGFRSLHHLSRLPEYSRHFFNSRTFLRKEETIFRAIDTRRIDVLEKHIQRFHGSVKELTTDRATPLHYLAGHGSSPGWQEPEKKFAQLLIAKGASVHDKNAYNETPLDIVSQAGYSGLTQLFLEHGAKVDENTLLKALLRAVNSTLISARKMPLIKGSKGAITKAKGWLEGDWSYVIDGVYIRKETSNAISSLIKDY